MNSISTRLDDSRPYVLSLFRIVTGFLFACHGAASLFGVFGGAPGIGGAIPAGTWPSWYAAVIQFVGGILAVLGLFTRATALIASGSMAYAYFTVHQSGGLLPVVNHGEPAVMFCWAFFLILFTGPGALALDGALAARRTTAPAPAPVAVNAAAS